MDWLLRKITDFSPAEYDEVYRSLSDSRKTHIDKMKLKDDKQRSLLATAIVNELLGKMGEAATLSVGENGKPVLKGSELFVSISHSNEAVVCAVSHEPVGIDIELIKPVKAAFIKRVCTKEELEYVLPDADKIKDLVIEDTDILIRFFKVWTAKEAYFKKHGTTGMLKTQTLPLKKEQLKRDGYIITIM
ncbi:MAG: 4'-phosphopantetheinyl transferase superfamily protein [Clostridia bacterium]|nr:4'-phosphopantetheinyl transferase superfamily protein [Clostridia bacterium]